MGYIYNHARLVAVISAASLLATSVEAIANSPVLEPVVESAQAGATAPLSGDSALKTALIAPQATTEEARIHYQTTAYRGLWIDASGDDTKAKALVDALNRAGEHALPSAKYNTPLLRAALDGARGGDSNAIAAAEIALTNAFLIYARDLSSGLLEPRRIDRDLHVFPERPQAPVLLAALARTSDAAAFLANLAPRHPHYDGLKAELNTLVSLGVSGAWGAEAPKGGSIRLGQRGPRIEVIRARLGAMGDYKPAIPAVDPAEYDEGLEAAVRAFQKRHGLNDDGVTGKRTVEALNKSAVYRAGQIVVNMERLRWLNRDLGHKHVVVNQADYNVKVIEGDKVLFTERVVIGKSRKHRTPEFSDEMTHMVFNPTWHVPYSIASKEILPKLQEDPEYLAKKNMRLLARGEGGEFDPTLTDWSLYSENDFPFIVKQRPGGGNALGRVKFMFPNQFNIYLHDTPSKRLFKKDARAFSHGCVRVQDPMELARVLLAPQQAEPSSYIESILNRRKERKVSLAEPMPVHLTYRTAWVDPDGTYQFRADVYGRDARILAALRAVGVDAAPES